MGREFELKYRANPEQIKKIQECYEDFTAISMETTYYDTFDMKFMMHHWTLRRRMENGVSVCTFKKPLDDGSKAQIEWMKTQGTEGRMGSAGPQYYGGYHAAVPKRRTLGADALRGRGCTAHLRREIHPAGKDTAR